LAKDEVGFITGQMTLLSLDDLTVFQPSMH